MYKYRKIIDSLDKNYSNGMWMTMYLTKLPEKQFMQYRNKSSSYFIHKQNLFEAAKCSCYTDVLTIDHAWLPKLPTSCSLIENIFCTKMLYLETNNRSYNCGSNFLQKREVNPLQSVLHYMCHTNVKQNNMSSKSNNF